MNDMIQNVCRERFAGKNVCVLGIGVSNIPLIDFLLSFDAHVTACDQKSSERLGKLADDLEKRGVKLFLGDRYCDGVSGDFVFRTPGIRPDVESIVKAVENGAVLTSEMELFMELCPCHTVGITGSDGKTTTTTLISEILKKSGKKVFLGGNIGAPLLPRVFEMQPEDYAVIELSSFQLQTMKKSAQIAVVTNITPNHLNWHVDMQEYIDAKTHVFCYQNPGDRLVLNADDPVSQTLGGQNGVETARFSCRGNEAEVTERDGAIRFGDREVIKTSDILIPGHHNVENYMTAIAALAEIVSADTIREIARTFPGVEHRNELVKTVNGVKYYNSSIDSSPNRTINALLSYPKKVILLCGGADKHIPYDALGKPLCEHTKAIITTGPTGPVIEKAARDCPLYKEGAPAIYSVGNYGEAVALASKIAVDGDIVLLSPASTSFDAFENFMERGNYFKELVNNL